MNIHPTEVQIALERLERLDLIEVKRTPLKGVQERSIKKISPKKDLTTTKTPLSIPAFRKLQKQILQMAIDALEDTPIELRDQSSLTIGMDPACLPEAKKMLKNFRRKFDRCFSDLDGKKEVYQLSLSLYPVSTIHKN